MQVRTRYTTAHRLLFPTTQINVSERNQQRACFQVHKYIHLVVELDVHHERNSARYWSIVSIHLFLWGGSVTGQNTPLNIRRNSKVHHPTVLSQNVGTKFSILIPIIPDLKPARSSSSITERIDFLEINGARTFAPRQPTLQLRVQRVAKNKNKP